MLKTSMSIIIWGITLLPPVAHSIVLQYVFCENINTTEWHWLQDSEGDDIQVRGVWQYTLDDPMFGAVIKAFKVPKTIFYELNQACQDEFGQAWVAHPAQSLWDRWYLFFYTEGSRKVFSQGSYDYSYY